MNFARLHLKGTEAALHEIHGRLDSELDIVWLAGEARPGDQGPHRESFLSKALSEGDSPTEVTAKVMRLLRRWRRKGISFGIPGLRAAVSYGVGVGSAEQFVAWVSLAPADLQLFVELGLAFDVSAYPISDVE